MKLRIAHITCATEAEAQEVARLLGEGADFAELAKQRSAAPDAERGGDVGRYLGPGELPRELWTAVRGLSPGEVAGPLAAGSGFELLTVLDSVSVPIEEAGPAVAAALKRRRAGARRQAWLEELERRFSVAYYPEAVIAMVRAGADGFRGRASRGPPGRDLGGGQGGLRPGGRTHTGGKEDESAGSRGQRLGRLGTSATGLSPIPWRCWKPSAAAFTKPGSSSRRWSWS